MELKVQHITKCFRDIGGIDNTLKELGKMFIHIKLRDFYFQLDLLPSRGILLHGPPGCGKTFLARAISGPVGGISGESEERVGEVFQRAMAFSPCVLFIDEIDAIGGDRQNVSRDMNCHIVSQLISSLDNLKVKVNDARSVVVIAATTRPDLDPELLRIGRFDHEFAIRIPTSKERCQILRLHCKILTVDPKLNFDNIAELTPGYVGADLKAHGAADVAMERRSLKKIREQHAITLDDDEPSEEPAAGNKSSEKEAKTDGDKEKEKADKPKEKHVKQEAKSPEDESYEPTLDNPPNYMAEPLLCLTLADLLEAIKVMHPSAKQESFVTVPDPTWDDIEGWKDIRKERMAVLLPVKYVELLERLGKTVPSGILLCDPPGCGKALQAKAIANVAGINFISVKGPELMNMDVDESERPVRACFQRARNGVPCVIFFEEFDSLYPVDQLVTEMDGVEERKEDYSLPATNRPDAIDPPFLRLVRLESILYGDLPEADERAFILRMITRNRKDPVLAEDVNLDGIAKLTLGYTGADLAGLVRLASMFSRNAGNDLCVRRHHFIEALQQIQPSITDQIASLALNDMKISFDDDEELYSDYDDEELYFDDDEELFSDDDEELSSGYDEEFTSDDEEFSSDDDEELSSGYDEEFSSDDEEFSSDDDGDFFSDDD